MKLSAYRAAWRNNTVKRLAERKWKPHSSTPYAADLKLYRDGVRLPRDRYLALIREYHQSPEWHARRIIRFAEYAGLCAECEAPATELHHNAGYGRLFEETLEELLPLCRACHERRSKRPPPVEIISAQSKPIDVISARPNWECANCQTDNVGEDSECFNCETSRTTSTHIAWKAQSMKTAAFSLPNPHRLVSWLCPICDCLNNLNAMQCEDCGKLRPLAAVPW